MKISGICFTRTGYELSLRILEVLTAENGFQQTETAWFSKGSFRSSADRHDPVQKLETSLHSWTEDQFSKSDILVFVGAAGIAVRAVAPFVKDKRHDPAVVVLDERGRFCIPLLSGHIGGANAFAGRIADLIGSTPIITTATDINDLFAVDVYAKKHDMLISSMTYAKEVSASILSGEPVGFFTSFPVKGDLPAGLVWSDKLERALEASGERAGGISLGIYISPSYLRAYFDHTLWLIPKCLSVGIGCKKGTSAQAIEALVNKTLDEACLYREAISSIATIDLKKDEPGLLEYCAKYGYPLHTYSAEELAAVEGEFDSSAFVAQQTGVDNVCGRSAVLDSGLGKMDVAKVAKDGVTCSVARKRIKLTFDE